MDHVISRQHGGSDDPGNLAFACLFCNRCKGTNVGSIGTAGKLVRLYNPRTDRWDAHFQLEGSVIQPSTPEGAATARLLRFNDRERVIERDLLQRLGHSQNMLQLKKMRELGGLLGRELRFLLTLHELGNASLRLQ